MYWNILIFTYLDTNLLLKLFFKEKELFKKFACSIITHYYSISNKEIIFNNIFLEYINIYPRITHLITKKLNYNFEIINIQSNDPTIEMNRYIYNGKEPNNISLTEFNKFIYSNYILPHPKNSSIPFTIGLSKKDKFEMVMSNIFYFEVFLDSYHFRKPFKTEILKIGFSDIKNDCNEIKFGKDNTFGVDLINNVFISSTQKIYLPYTILKGDTVGIGLEYIDKYIYKPFLTYNGKIIDITIKNIITTKELKVITSLRMSTGIDINFGNKDFLFDIEKINNSNKLIYTTNKNLINNGYSLKNFTTEELVSNKKSNTENIYNFLT
tara:strand:- start:1524 stop:2495 length:972 start_codon:yes stop_codon:yes gene_type:complete